MERPARETLSPIPDLRSFSQQAAEGAQAIHNQQEQGRAAARAGEVTITLPNGGIARITDVVDHEYLSEEHTAIFADPARFMEHVQPGEMYVWAAKGDPRTFGRIRARLYEPVTRDEIREDCDMPIETHRTAGGDEYVACFDVVLMRVPALAVKKLYKWREMQAKLRTANALPFQKLRERVQSESGGGVDAEMSFQVE